MLFPFLLILEQSASSSLRRPFCWSVPLEPRSGHSFGPTWCAYFSIVHTFPSAKAGRLCFQWWSEACFHPSRFGTGTVIFSSTWCPWFRPRLPGKEVPQTLSWISIRTIDFDWNGFEMILNRVSQRQQPLESIGFQLHVKVFLPLVVMYHADLYGK